jgi:hypothetical protein
MTTLTEQEAYAAMYAFLDLVYQATQSDDLGSLLGGLSTLEDGGPADPAYGYEWLECVELAKQGKVDTRLRFIPEEHK